MSCTTKGTYKILEGTHAGTETSVSGSRTYVYINPRLNSLTISGKPGTQGWEFGEPNFFSASLSSISTKEAITEPIESVVLDIKLARTFKVLLGDNPKFRDEIRHTSPRFIGLTTQEGTCNELSREELKKQTAS